MKKIEISKEKLNDLYWNKKLSIPKIAKLYKCSQKPIWKNLHKYSIKVRKPKSINISKKKLIKLYKTKRLRITKLAKLYNCSKETIYNKLHEYKIKLFSNKIEIKRQKLYDLYTKKKLSTSEIAKIYGCSSTPIWKKLHQAGIKLRSPLKKIKISKNLLKILYIDKKLPNTTISRKIGCSPVTIRNRLREYELPVRNLKEAKNLRDGIKIDKKELSKLYLNKKLSCTKIANIYKCDDEVIRERLHRFNIPIRSNYETSTIYKKYNFSGDLEEKSYLIGFRLGDLHVQKIRDNSKVICVRCGSTKQVQLDLIKNLFLKYGGVWIGNPDKKGARRICCSLNMSFSFLLKKEDNIPKWVRNNSKNFFAFLAGYLDAEGHIEIDRKGCAKLIVGSYDKNMLHQFYYGLISRGIFCLKPRMIRKKGMRKDGIIHRGDTWALGIYRKTSLLKTFNTISPYLKHGKRVNDMRGAMNNIIERNKKYK